MEEQSIPAPMHFWSLQFFDAVKVYTILHFGIYVKKRGGARKKKKERDKTQRGWNRKGSGEVSRIG